MSKSSHDFNGLAQRIRDAVAAADPAQGIGLPELYPQVHAVTRRDRANVAHQCSKMWRYGILQRLDGVRPYRYISGRAPRSGAYLTPAQRRANRNAARRRWAQETRTATQAEYDAAVQRLQAQGLTVRQVYAKAAEAGPVTREQLYAAAGLTPACAYTHTHAIIASLVARKVLLRHGNGPNTRFTRGPNPVADGAVQIRQQSADRQARLTAYKAEVAKRAAERAAARQRRREQKAAEEQARRERLHGTRAKRKEAKLAAQQAERERRAAQRLAARQAREAEAAERARKRAEAAKAKAEAKARAEADRAAVERRKQQRELERERKKALARGAALRQAIATTLKQTAANATKPVQAPAETLEKFLARGGQIQVLPHNFDAPRPLPGRRPGLPSNF